VIAIPASTPGVMAAKAVDVAPNFYPAGTGVWQVMPCWAVMAAVRGAEPSGTAEEAIGIADEVGAIRGQVGK
jgi:hypothetical protein